MNFDDSYAWPTGTLSTVFSVVASLLMIAPAVLLAISVVLIRRAHQHSGNVHSLAVRRLVFIFLASMGMASMGFLIGAFYQSLSGKLCSELLAKTEVVSHTLFPVSVQCISHVDSTSVELVPDWVNPMTTAHIAVSAIAFAGASWLWWSRRDNATASVLTSKTLT